MRKYEFFVYIMANCKNGTLYIGVTNDIRRRVYEHKNNVYPGCFTARYGCDKLVYCEDYQYINDALEREKRLKAGSRKRKIQLIESVNPDWIDLAEQDNFWFG